MPVFYFIVVLCVVMGTATSADPTFEPGCSFYGGKCVYSIKLGHKGQCDTPQPTTAPSSGGCSTDLTAKYSKLRDEQDKLKTKVDVLTSMMTDSSNTKSELEKKLRKALTDRNDIVNVLNRNEAELKSTKDELAKVMAKASKEIQNLRSSVKTCQSTLTGGDVRPSGTNNGAQAGDYRLTYFNFNGDAGGFNVVSKGKQGITLLEKGSSTTTGPRADHTLGCRKGSYLGIDTNDIATHRYGGTLLSYQSISNTFPIASGYCILFWYYMEGTDVQTLSMNIKIKGGFGYPVFTRTGQVNSDKWELAQIDLTSEYSQNEFQISFEMTTAAYNEYDRSIRKTVNRKNHGDIAVDDLYVYNTSCSNIPRYPKSQSFYHNNVTSFYTFHLTPMTWTEAYDVCRREGPWSALVSIETAAEQTALVNMIKSNSAYRIVGAKGFYTSGSDYDTEKHYIWTHEGVQEENKFNNWHTGQPNNVAGNQNCLLMEYPNDDFKWGDVNCDTKHPFICEVEVPK